MINALGFLGLLFSTAAWTEAGSVYEGDLKADGVLDRIESGPWALFGNTGDPFLIF
jgi:hypothetical protein